MNVALVASVIAIAVASGCRAKATSTPHDLTVAYLDAVEHDDPDAAYDLLSAETKARISREAFKERWERNVDELETDAEAARSMSAEEREPVMEGRTTHPGGRSLRWTRVGGEFVVVSGLPGIPATLTPQSTVRAFIAALRASPAGHIEGLVTPQLAEAVSENWAAKADAMEEALERPGAIEHTADYERAVLRYGVGGVVVLEQTSRGWRIRDLQ